MVLKKLLEKLSDNCKHKNADIAKKSDIGAKR
jgi:hypothetical protein